MPRISTRIEPIDRTIELMLSPLKDPAERSAQFAAFAAEQISGVSKHNDEIAGRHIDYTVAVDGSQGKPLSAVRPDGTIVAEWAAGLQIDVIRWIYARIVAVSPVLTGQYSRSHIILADGNEVSDLTSDMNAEEWVITVTVPYARKLEGMSGNRPPLSRQAPHGVYQVAAEEARARFGNMAAIKFTARSVQGGAISEWAATTTMSARGHASGRRRLDWLSRQPAIVVRFR